MNKQKFKPYSFVSIKRLPKEIARDCKGNLAVIEGSYANIFSNVCPEDTQIYRLYVLNKDKVVIQHPVLVSEKYLTLLKQQDINEAMELCANWKGVTYK